MSTFVIATNLKFDVFFFAFSFLPYDKTNVLIFLLSFEYHCHHHHFHQNNRRCFNRHRHPYHIPYQDDVIQRQPLSM